MTNDTPPVNLSETRTIVLRRIKSGSLFKLIFAGALGVLVPLFTLFSIGALFGAHTVKFNQQSVTGVGGLIVGMVMGPVFAAVVSVFAWAGASIGIYVWGRFEPLVIEYLPPKEKS